MNNKPVHSGVFLPACQYPVVRFLDSTKEEKGSMTISNANKGFFCVSNSLIDEFGKKIGPNGIAIYLALRRFANRKDMACFPAQQTIADLVGCTDRNVRNYLAVLIEHRLVIKEPRFKSGKQLTNNYQLDKLGQKRFFMVRCDVLDTFGRDIGVYGLAVYAAMVRFADSSGVCFPSYQVMADLIGVGRSSVLRAMKDLEGHSLVVKETRIGEKGGYKPNIYKVSGMGGGVCGSTPLVSVVPPPSVCGSTPLVSVVPPPSVCGSDELYPINQTHINHTHKTRGPAEEGAPSDSMCVGASLSSKSSSTSVGRETERAGNVKGGSASGSPLTENKEEGFAEFWAQYPLNTIDREPARRFWVSMKAEDQKKALEGVVRYAEYVERKKKQKSYILDLSPRAAAWLKNKSWENIYGPVEAFKEVEKPTAAMREKIRQRDLLEDEAQKHFGEKQRQEVMRDSPLDGQRALFDEACYIAVCGKCDKANADLQEFYRLNPEMKKEEKTKHM